MSPRIYNTIDYIIGEHGGGEALARDLKNAIGDDIAAAAQDQMLAYRQDDPPPNRLGYTELEAAMRWCPHVREVTPLAKGLKDAAIGNRYLDRDGSEFGNPAGCACIASYCLSWRWLDDLRGYCGLAGQPTFQPVREPRRLPNRTPLERPTASEQRDLFDSLVDTESGRGANRSAT